MANQPVAALAVVAALCATAACSATLDNPPASAAGRSEVRGTTATSSAEATPSEAPGGTWTGGEGAAPVSGPPGLPDLGPPDRRPLDTVPMPPFTSRRGVVAGYPHEGLPVVPGSRGLLTSVSPDRRRLHVALDGLVPRAPGKVLRFYRVHFEGLGFTERTTTATPGSEAAGFRRGGNVVTVTATRRDGATSYIVFATLRAGEV